MTPRARTLVHLERLRAIALGTAAGAATSSCVGFKVVDPIPDSDYRETGLSYSTSASAVWTSTGNIILNVDTTRTLGDPTLTGGTLVDGSGDGGHWSGEIDPDEGATEVVLSFPLTDDSGVATELVVHVYTTDTPTTGASVPVSVED